MIHPDSELGANGRENSFKSDFFNRMGPSYQIQRLFDYVPGTSFFMKDEQSRMVSVSQSIVDRFGLAHEDEVIGRNDYDFFPAHIADSFVRDDKLVISTGQPMIDRVEIWYTEHLQVADLRETGNRDRHHGSDSQLRRAPQDRVAVQSNQQRGRTYSRESSWPNYGRGTCPTSQFIDTSIAPKIHGRVWYECARLFNEDPNASGM